MPSRVRAGAVIPACLGGSDVVVVLVVVVVVVDVVDVVGGVKVKSIYPTCSGSGYR